MKKLLAVFMVGSAFLLSAVTVHADEAKKDAKKEKKSEKKEEKKEEAKPQ